jgi:hypothetical protein
MDKQATLAKLKQIRAAENSIIASEVNFIRTNRVGLILADIPPLAAKIAKAAGIPGWMMGNFGWDFIYQDWGGEFIEMAQWISECYNECDRDRYPSGNRTFRLPLHEPMTNFPNITDVGLTGGSPRYSLDELRQTFGLNVPPEKTILLTFGGLGLQEIPYNNICQFPDWQFITFDSFAPHLPNLLKVKGHDYRPVDFMPLCGRVVSKPGYSTFAEALRLDVPIVSLTREDFAESAVLLSGIQNHAYHQILTPTEFFGENWEFLRDSPQPPKDSQGIAKDGTEAIAQSIISYFHL